MQCNHIDEEMRGLHVVKDGQEHGTNVAIVYSIGTTEVEVWTEIVAEGQDEDID